VYWRGLQAETRMNTGESQKRVCDNRGMTRTLVRYWDESGWHHAELVKAGRKWLRVLDLYLSRRKKDNSYYRRVRRVRREDAREALWQ